MRTRKKISNKKFVKIWILCLEKVYKGFVQKLNYSIKNGFENFIQNCKIPIKEANKGRSMYQDDHDRVRSGVGRHVHDYYSKSALWQLVLNPFKHF